LAYKLTDRSYAAQYLPPIPDFWDRRTAGADVASLLDATSEGHIVQRDATAHGPEELSTQLEDAFLVGDLRGLAELFDERAVLAPHNVDVDVLGSDAIAMFAAALCAADRRYLGQVRRVVQTGDTAAVVVDWSLTGRGSADGTHECGRGVDVLRRGSNGAWRYLISLMRVCERSKEEQRERRRP
jgi:ketosteroid isomerase-like protein